MQITNKKYFARGKRGIIYTANLGKKKIAIKVKRQSSEAHGRMKNEAYWMKTLNKYKIGPKFISFDGKKVIYEFVEGIFLPDFLENCNKSNAKKIIKEIFSQMFTMDKLGVRKEEMHRPIKHVIITKRLKPIIIDFERCHLKENPGNVTQFCQFIISGHAKEKLENIGIKVDKKKMISAAKKYKDAPNKKNLDNILQTINQ